MNRNRTIYLIEDDPAIRESLNIFLELEGYTVRMYASARSFLDTVVPTESGCILTDIYMPEMNGLDLLASLNERGVFMPAIVMSGCFDAGLEIKARKLGAVDFFKKPFDPEVLLAAIGKALTRANDDRVPPSGLAELQRAACEARAS
jgi:two-component system, LuxR family, response regulator FixJ